MTKDDEYIHDRGGERDPDHVSHKSQWMRGTSNLNSGLGATGTQLSVRPLDINGKPKSYTRIFADAERERNNRKAAADKPKQETKLWGEEVGTHAERNEQGSDLLTV